MILAEVGWPEVALALVLCTAAVTALFIVSRMPARPDRLAQRIAAYNRDPVRWQERTTTITRKEPKDEVESEGEADG